MFVCLFSFGFPSGMQKVNKFRKWVHLTLLTSRGPAGLKAEVGSLSFMSKSTTLLHLSIALYTDLTLYPDRHRYFWPIMVISESMCSYWLLYTVLPLQQMALYKLIGY